MPAVPLRRRLRVPVVQDVVAMRRADDDLVFERAPAEQRRVG
jgi:hypothetical protein